MPHAGNGKSIGYDAGRKIVLGPFRERSRPGYPGLAKKNKRKAQTVLGQARFPRQLRQPDRTSGILNDMTPAPIAPLQHRTRFRMGTGSCRRHVLLKRSFTQRGDKSSPKPGSRLDEQSRSGWLQ